MKNALRWIGGTMMVSSTLVFLGNWLWLIQLVQQKPDNALFEARCAFSLLTGGIGIWMVLFAGSMDDDDRRNSR